MPHPTPMRKKDFHRVQHKIGLPYPNYGIDIDELPIICRCFSDEGNFYVTHQQDIPTLYRNGCFGKSSITHRGPTSLMDMSHEKKYYYQKLIGKLEKEKDDTSNGIRNMESNGKCTSGTSSKSETRVKQFNANGIPTDELEKLVLLPEEVIFLSFGVGCLSIQNAVSSETIGYRDVWKSLVQQNPEFPFIYAVYHYFRSKNWVPKSGTQYGGDYILYQLGPDFYHSTFVVYITGLPSRPKLNWSDLHALQRVAITANKNVLLCEVDIPKDFQAAESRPNSIFDLRIRETVISRWTPFGPAPQED